MNPWKHAARLLSKARAHAIVCGQQAQEDYTIVVRAVWRATGVAARCCDDAANAVDAMAAENAALREQVATMQAALVSADAARMARCPEMRHGDAGQERCVLFVHGGDGHAFASDETCDGCEGPLGDDAEEQGESGMATLCGECVKKAKAEQKERDRQAAWLAEDVRQR